MADYFPQADPDGNCCDCPDRASPCDPCAGCAPTLCCLSDPDNEEITFTAAIDPGFTNDWETVCATPISLEDSGSGYYRKAGFFQDIIGTEHSTLCDFGNPDFAIAIRPRLYPVADRWHLTAVGIASGSVYCVFFYADISQAELDGADADGSAIQSDLTSCVDSFWTGDDAAIWNIDTSGIIFTLTAAFRGVLRIALP